MKSTSKTPTIAYLEIKSEADFPKQFHRLYHTHLYCHRGSIRFLFNDQEMECTGGQFLFWFAESRLSGLWFSKSFRATVLLAEKAFLNENVPDQGWNIDAVLHSRTYPVKEINSLHRKEKILSNFSMLHERFAERGHLFYAEVLQLQMRIFILEMWDVFAETYEKHKHTVQTGTVYEQYMQLLGANCLQQREVQFYASQLHLTPKYLNHLCKMQSGITASEWIQRYARERIIILLQNEHLNVSEIADEMEFSSRSFFTRYVKKLLGVTPTEYRARLG